MSKFRSSGRTVLIPGLHTLQHLRLAFALQPRPLLLSFSFGSEAFLGRFVQDLLFESSAFAGFSFADAFLVRSVFLVSAEDEVAPSEGSGEVIDERHVVEVMMISTRPERNEVVQ